MDRPVTPSSLPPSPTVLQEPPRQTSAPTRSTTSLIYHPCTSQSLNNYLDSLTTCQLSGPRLKSSPPNPLATVKDLQTNAPTAECLSYLLSSSPPEVLAEITKHNPCLDPVLSVQFDENGSCLHVSSLSHEDWVNQNRSGGPQGRHQACLVAHFYVLRTGDVTVMESCYLAGWEPPMTTIAQCSGASLSEDAGDAVLDDGAMFNPEVNDDLGTVATVANSVSARTLRDEWYLNLEVSKVRIEKLDLLRDPELHVNTIAPCSFCVLEFSTTASNANSHSSFLFASSHHSNSYSSLLRTITNGTRVYRTAIDPDIQTTTAPTHRQTPDYRKICQSSVPNQRGRRKVLKDHQACLVAHCAEAESGLSGRCIMVVPEGADFAECGRLYVLERFIEGSFAVLDDLVPAPPPLETPFTEAEVSSVIEAARPCLLGGGMLSTAGEMGEYLNLRSDEEELDKPFSDTSVVFP
ncbi:hypothetical protein BDV98DRAFT_644315 [Pterulicium gracile]|uniref:Uncharacterized protein n=1 Tax=Pterulicium gracile TaxID=1884261 RepID=A0A5C3QNI1_9AGAR|nr:hypothetical protein BDV98DRAFT_644315 [Pterula gracilis]